MSNYKDKNQDCTLDEIYKDNISRFLSPPLFCFLLSPYGRGMNLGKGLKISFRQKEREQALKSLAAKSYSW